jgi:hypothetical protein
LQVCFLLHFRNHPFVSPMNINYFVERSLIRNTVRHLISEERLPFTATYFGSIVLTLYFAIGVSLSSYRLSTGALLRSIHTGTHIGSMPPPLEGLWSHHGRIGGLRWSQYLWRTLSFDLHSCPDRLLGAHMHTCLTHIHPGCASRLLPLGTLQAEAPSSFCYLLSIICMP